MLDKLLESLMNLEGSNQFDISILIVDNDGNQSAFQIVEVYKAKSKFPIKYFVEPNQNIALARNMAVEKADGDYIAFVDDDETVSPQWINELFKTVHQNGYDGAFGPIMESFFNEPPNWLKKGKFFNRRTNLKTGHLLNYKQTSSGNCFLKKKVLNEVEGPFDPDFGLSGGEDTALFKKLIDLKKVFVCVADAITYEWIPEERANLKYLVRRAFLGGFIFTSQLKNNLKNAFTKVKFVLRTIALIGFYFILMPFKLFFGFHKFVQCLLGISIQIGKLAALLRFSFKEYGRPKSTKLEFV